LKKRDRKIVSEETATGPRGQRRNRNPDLRHTKHTITRIIVFTTMQKFITANGVALRIDDCGAADTTLVLLHGYLESLEIWEDLLERLRPRYRVLSIDIPGHGISQVCGEIHTMEFIADTLEEVLDKQRIGRCFVVGHSMGGYAALAFADRYPDRVQGLLLFHSTPEADSEEKKDSRKREIELIRSGKKELIAKLFAPKGFAEENRRRLNDRIGQLEEMIQIADDDGIVALLNGMMRRRDMNDRLRELGLPTLLVFGRHDESIPVESAERIAAAHPEAEIAWLDRSGHMGFIEEPDAAAELVRSFIDRHAE